MPEPQDPTHQASRNEESRPAASQTGKIERATVASGGVTVPPQRTQEELTEIDGRGHPIAASHAQIVNYEELKGLNPSPSKIRAYLDLYMRKTDQSVPSVPTIMRILKGLPGSYVSVNWVFTALSAEWGSLNRERFIAVGERTGAKELDINLGYCCVFPRLATLMGELKVSHVDLSHIAYVERQSEIDLVGDSILSLDDEKKYVKPDYILKARRGLPVRRDKVMAIFAAMNSQFSCDLDVRNEIFS